MPDQSTWVFWLQLAIQALVAAGTLGAVVMAVYGDWIRGKIARPLLTLRLRYPEGEAAVMTDGEGARYYQLDVTNSRWWAPARNVTVYLTGLDVAGVAGDWRPILRSGLVPLNWQFGAAQVTIGHPRVCDLIGVLAGGAFAIATPFSPNYLADKLQGMTEPRLRFTVAENGESEPLHLLFDWNGKWHEGAREMAEHLSIREEPQPSAPYVP